MVHKKETSYYKEKQRHITYMSMFLNTAIIGIF